MKAIWNWIKSLFTWDRIGIIWRAMFQSVGNAAAEMVSDPVNQAKAWDLAKNLMSSSLSNENRRDLFNSKMREWAESAGRQLTEAAINALRENAVVALKSQGSVMWR